MFSYDSKSPQKQASKKSKEQQNSKSQQSIRPSQLGSNGSLYQFQLQQHSPMMANKTGLPDNLKAGVENLSGLSMDDVRVHYHSDKPAKIGALAYTQGTDIHVAPGQEKHLPHESWHVVQQAQGRVQATLQSKNIAVNNDIGLEREADLMGERASKNTISKTLSKTKINNTIAVSQRKIIYDDYSRYENWSTQSLGLLGKRIDTYPAYRYFHEKKGLAIHINTSKVEQSYYRELAAIFSDPSNAELQATQLQILAPNVEITEDKTYSIAIGGKQQIEFTDVERTPEEQEMALSKKEVLGTVVSDAKIRIQKVLSTLIELSTNIDAKCEAVSLLKDQLQSILNTDENQIASVVRVLALIFQKMANRLSKDVIELSTMSRQKTLRQPGTLGCSGPKNLTTGWKMDDGKSALVADWLKWLHESDEDFGGYIAIRLDANQLTRKEDRMELLPTFIHELSHAAASTRDFAYLHQKEEYDHLDFLHRLGNADTIALIAMVLTGDSSQQESEQEQKEVKQNLSKIEVVKLLIEAAKEYKVDGVLQVKADKILSTNGFTWDAVRQSFDKDNEDIQTRLEFIFL